GLRKACASNDPQRPGEARVAREQRPGLQMLSTTRIKARSLTHDASAPIRRVFVRNALIAWPQEQRYDPQDGEAARDAGEAVNARKNGGGWRGSLAHRDDEGEGSRGADIAPAVRARLYVHADPHATADQGQPPRERRHVQRQATQRHDAAEQAAHEAV